MMFHTLIWIHLDLSET